jgi:hypothetical protein
LSQPKPVPEGFPGRIPAVGAGSCSFGGIGGARRSSGKLIPIGRRDWRLLRQRDDRDGLFIQIAIGKTGAAQNSREGFLRRKLTDRTLGLESVDCSGEVHNLHVTVLSERLERRAEILRRDIGWPLDRGTRIIRNRHTGNQTRYGYCNR